MTGVNTRYEEKGVARKKIENWKTNLLDLTRKNRQLNFRPKGTQRSPTVEIIYPYEGTLFHRLLTGNGKFNFVSVFQPLSQNELLAMSEEDRMEYEEKLPTLHMNAINEAKRMRRKYGLITQLYDNDLSRVLTRYRRRDELFLSERGINILYITFGLLEWYDISSHKPQYSPILFIPVVLIHKEKNKPIQLRCRDTEVQENLALSLKLQRDFGIDVPEFEEDLESYYSKIVQVISKIKKTSGEWKLHHRTFISSFTFSKINLYQDLETHELQLLNHPIISAIASGQRLDTKLDEFNGSLDQLDPREVYTVFDADSSQQLAIQDAIRGNSMIIRGPPGTGKSQTITNLIAEFLARGKKILFVAQKMAALEVVKSRLDQAGLGNFCLEIHSNKANKKDIIQQLVEMINSEIEKPVIPSTEFTKYKMTVDSLNQYVEEIAYRKTGGGRTLYDLISEYCSLREVDTTQMQLFKYSEITDEVYQQILEGLRYIENNVDILKNRKKDILTKWKIKVNRTTDLEKLLESIDSLYNSIDLYLIKKADITYSLDLMEHEPIFTVDTPGTFPLRRVVETFKEVIDSLERFHLVREKIVALDLIKLEVCRDNFSTIGDCTSQATSLMDEFRAISMLIIELEHTLKTNIEAIDEFVKEVTELKGQYTPLQLNTDVRKIHFYLVENKSLKRYFDLNYYRVRSYFQKYFPDKKIEFIDRLLKFLEKWNIQRINNENRFLQIVDEIELRLEKYMSQHSEYSQGEVLDLKFPIVVTTMKIKKFISQNTTTLNSLQTMLMEITSLTKTIDSGFRTLTQYLDLETTDIYTDDNIVETLRNHQEEIQEMYEVTKKVEEDIATFQKYSKVAKKMNSDDMLSEEFLDNFEPLVQSSSKIETIVELERHLYIIGRYLGRKFVKSNLQKLEDSLAVDTFKKMYLQANITSIIERTDVLNNVNSTKRKKLIDRFIALDTKLLNYNKARVIDILFRQKGKQSVFENSLKYTEKQILIRESMKKRKIMPIRKLFSRVRNYITQLKPCFLMSPLSVASYLEGNAFDSYFDVVIFDEASQIPPEDAVGAILRGKQLIVVGDEKQLPPTKFFLSSVVDEDDENEDYYIMDSILEECIGIGILEKMLKWHYRSRREQLITFSNYNFYSGKLHTFPDPVKNGLSDDGKIEDLAPLTFHRVDGVYDKGGTRTNRSEAEVIVKKIIQHFEICFQENQYYSLGVISFNEQQATLIQNLFDKYLEKNPIFEQKYLRLQEREKLFVKNLENVQGDERDVIFFSVTYGPDRYGKISLNFGPLNKNGGERRLNVAITRARYHVTIFSSFSPNEVNYSNSRSKGLRLFMEYLRFAQNGFLENSTARTSSGTNFFESPFEEEVLYHLEKRGYAVDTQIGAAGYRIDLGVLDPNRPDRYIMGIECDGASYHSTRYARDRDRLRHQILESLGWTIYHIWSTDWFKNKEEVLDDIDRQIRRLLHKSSVKEKELKVKLTVPTILSKSTFSLPKVRRINTNGTKEKADLLAIDTREELLKLPDILEYRRFDTEGVSTYQSLIAGNGVQGIIDKIVIVEGPVHREIVENRLLKYYSARRTAGAKKLFRKLFKNTEFFGEEFYFSKIRITLNPKEETRKFKHIYPPELKNAMRVIIENSLSIPDKYLFRSTLALFGIKGLKQEYIPRLRKLLDELVMEENYIAQNNYISKN